jgi:tetratricopeptide (TPR) repeat protein
MNKHLFSLTLLVIVAVNISYSQCETWVGKPTQTDAENAHSIYRQALKAKDYPTAFENWQTAYKLAPAADGKRDYHYTDGVVLYKDLLTKTTEDKVKTEYHNKIIQLYDQAIACYTSKAITTKNATDEEMKWRIGYLYGRKAADMFYIINAPYEDVLVALDKTIEYSGDKTEYTIFDPYARIVVYEFKEKRFPKEKAVSIYKRMQEIAEYNISNNEKLSEGYQQAKANMEGTFSEIEKDIFDCAYFKEKLIPEYEENKEDAQTLKRVLATLKSQGCANDDHDIIRLDAEWKKYATTENARLQAEFEANNPAAGAKAAYDAGRYQEAITKYRQAIESATDNDTKATMMFAVASIEFRKLNLYSQARSTAYSAAKLKSGYGRPYLLIGDMYAKTARSCGDAFNQRLCILAAMDKYNQAKSVEPSIAEEANDKLSHFYGSVPDKSEAFMRGYSEGQSLNCGCWIGESVRLRVK